MVDRNDASITMPMSMSVGVGEREPDGSNGSTKSFPTAAAPQECRHCTYDLRPLALSRAHTDLDRD
jgi:hypothetical protein